MRSLRRIGVVAGLIALLAVPAASAAPTEQWSTSGAAQAHVSPSDVAAVRAAVQTAHNRPGAQASQAPAPKPVQPLTPAAISWELARPIVGNNIAHGPNVQIRLKRHYSDKRPQEVINDCSMFGPPIGYYYYGRTVLRPFNCAHQFLFPAGYPSPRDYRLLFARDLRLGRHLVSRAINRGQPPSQRVHLPSHGLLTVDTSVRVPGTDQVVMGAAIDRIVLTYDRNDSRGHRLLYQVLLYSNGSVLLVWADGSQRWLYNRRLT